MLFFSAVGMLWADALLEPERERLWERAIGTGQIGTGQTGKFGYIEGVPAIRSVSRVAPQAAALVNVLQYLNTRSRNPWPCFPPEALDAIAADAEKEFADMLASEGKRAKRDLDAALLMERLGYVLQDLADEDDAEEDDDAEDALYEMKEWMDASKGKAADINPLPSLGIERAYRLARVIGKSKRLSSLKSGLEKWAKTRLYKVETKTSGKVTFAEYCAAIDSGTPVLLRIGKRFVTGVGYWHERDGAWLIVHDPATSAFRVATEGETAFAEDHIGKKAMPPVPGCQFVKAGTATERMAMLTIVGWKRDFSGLRKKGEER